MSATHGSNCAIFLPKPTLKLHQKYQILVPAKYDRWETKGMLYHTETQQLLMKCFKTILGCTIQMEEASISFCKPHMGLTVPISTFVHSQISQKINTRFPVAIEYIKWDDIL